MRVLRRLLPALALAAAAALPRGTAAQSAGAALPGDSAAAPGTAATGTAAIDGVIVDVLGQPLAGAIVMVASSGRLDLSSERGRFAVASLPHGPQRFHVRRVGYKPLVFDVDLPERATVHVRVKLEPNLVTLGTVVIEGQNHSLGLWRAGFYDRAARQAMGYFYPPEEIMRRRLSSAAELLGEVPGLVIDIRGNQRVAFGRPVGAGPCPLNLWVDGALAAAGPADLDALAPGPLIRAIEVYPSASAVPGRYVRPGNKCGAILVWTKGVVQHLF